jgi:uncharacterized SAM-binding protein YcdF (DUF218 family)
LKINNFKKIKLPRIKLPGVKAILLILGILIFLYFTVTSIYWRRFDVFNFLVSLIGIMVIILSFKINLIGNFIKRRPKIIQYFLKIIFVCIILSFIIFQSIIIYNMRNTPETGADYVIVLGCQVVGEYASVPLLSRGYTAVRYLNRNPDAKVIVSGGKGSGENISEAEALRRLLLENKIEKERILMEDKSRNTMENFIFSNGLYNVSDKKIAIVTSDYHIYRALSIARKLKYTNVSGLPAKSQRSVLPAFLLREYAAVMYYKLLGRI